MAVNSLRDIKTRITKDIFKYLYQRQARRITETPPVDAGALPYTLLSMVHHRDVHSYLVAAKSFIRQAAPRKVVVVCDPSITADDRAEFRRQIRNLELRDAAEFTDDAIPTGGTWERLFAITEYAKTDYVVQLDADTITLGAIDEVLTAITARQAFVIGESPDQQIESLSDVARRAKSWLAPPYNSQHIQAVVEAAIEEVGLAPGQRYVRGCSGFTGFPADTEMRAKLLSFSTAMRTQHGPRWNDWGTEQISSNFLAANAVGCRVLPFPKYGTPDQVGEPIAFLHFIGYLRFINRKYEKATRHFIATARG